MSKSTGDNKYAKITTIATVITVLIMLISLIFGDEIIRYFKPQTNTTADVKASSTPVPEPTYTLIDENVLSVLSEEERDRLFPWKFVGMVYTDGYPTDTLAEKYEFVGYEDNWGDKLTPGKIWNHYVRQPIEE